MRIGAIIQARMQSERLPGKILLPLPAPTGPTVLSHVVQRAQSAEVEVIIATSDGIADDATALQAAALAVPCFRGSEHDVLGRMAGASKIYGLDLVFRLTADNPCIDPEIMRWVLAYFTKANLDYLRTQYLPLGMNIELFTAEALFRCDREQTDSKSREHVTPAMYQVNGNYKFDLLPVATSQAAPNLRLTLDTTADYTLIKEIFAALYPSNPAFGVRDIITFLSDHPDLMTINSHIEQKKL